MLGLTMVPAAPASGAERDLSRFYHQQPGWATCRPDPATDPPGSKIPWEKMDCATITVPLDYRHPGAGRLNVAISRLKAKDPNARRGVLLLNPGGPGGDGLDLPLAFANNAIAGSYDLIGFDPRGVGRSTRLRCDYPRSFLLHTRPTDEEFADVSAHAQLLELGCKRAGGGIRPFISTANTARDLDVVRGVLGEKKINYLGFSYGTYLGAVYGSLFPAHLDRSVLDSSMHPEWLYYEQFAQQAVAWRQNVDAWVAWIAERDRTYHLGSTVAAVTTALDELGLKLAAKPTPIKNPPPGFPEFALDRNFFDLLLGGVPRTRPLWDVFAKVVNQLRAATGARLDADTDAAVGQLAGQVIPPTYEGAFQAITCEADWPRELNTYYDRMRVFREKYPYGLGAIAVQPTECTFRSFTPPEPLVPLRRHGYPIGVVVQAEYDANTQYDGGPAMAARLGDNLISVADEGTHGLYSRNECVTRQIDAYFVHGVLPDSRAFCPGRPRPDVPPDKAGARPAPASPLRAEVSRIIAENGPDHFRWR
ncbi:alpha/beta fold hydrolase [Amycolatopsis samaneae]|uniref:Alpha/beta fold hydrolase n=1 Tax=Amycolatopsis samaneae TaxID=664691 RepID=A0ABW5GAC7_9PSEU